MKKQEYDYFNEFNKLAGNISESAEILDNILKNYSRDNLKENIEQIHKLEVSSDHVLHDMISYLIKDFLPPIDREDISLIIRRLDDVEDLIDEIAINFNIRNIEIIREDVLEFSKLVIDATQLLKAIFEEFKNFKKKSNIKEKIIEMNTIEEKGDRVFEKLMSKLYTDSIEPIEIIKWTSMYKSFEEILDSCERVADIIEDVIIKNS